MTQFIALCGYPKVGKTQIQSLIGKLYDFTAIDDSRPLRDAAKILYGLSEWQVSTQEGKSSLIDIGNKKESVRKVLGDLGAYLEASDEFHLPRRAVASCLATNPQGRFVFASVRRNQPKFFKSLGNALVIEITRPGCHPVGFFDDYDRQSVDISIENVFDPHNPGPSSDQLEARIRAALDPVLDLSPA